MAKTFIKLNSKGTLLCPICKAEYTPATPAPMSVYIAILKAFQKDHNYCKEVKSKTNK